jgi:hypothetical protein
LEAERILEHDFGIAVIGLSQDSRQMRQRYQKNAATLRTDLLTALDEQASRSLAAS